MKTNITIQLAAAVAAIAMTCGAVETFRHIPLSTPVYSSSDPLGVDAIRNIETNYVKMADLQDGIIFNTLSVSNITIDGKTPVELIDSRMGEYVKLADLQEGIQFNTMQVTNFVFNGKEPFKEMKNASEKAIQGIDTAESIEELKQVMKDYLNSMKMD